MKKANCLSTATRIRLAGKLKGKVRTYFHSIGESKLAIEPMSGDLDEAQETQRINYSHTAATTFQTLLDLKHSKTTPVSKGSPECAPPERSFTIPADPEIRLTEITDDELTTLTHVFKQKLKLPSFLKHQFDLISSLPPIPSETVERFAVKLPLPKRQKLTGKTIAFDLDDTLVYTMSDELLERSKIYPKADIRKATYSTLNGRTVGVNVVIRPYAIEMLKQLSPYYEIIIFTAAIKSYGDAIIDTLDPDGTLIDYRLYRENCIKVDGQYIKDLRILNRDLDSVVMVDNKIVSFSSQIENGIVVPAFSSSKPDSDLAALWVFLRQAVLAEDVRVPIASKYNIKLYYQLHNRIKGQQ